MSGHLSNPLGDHPGNPTSDQPGDPMSDHPGSDLPATAARLGLEQHPEGGWFRRTYTAPTPVITAGGPRPAATIIHYLLIPGEQSAWHVVSSDEMWLWHGPGALELSLGGTGDRPGSDITRVVLGAPSGLGAAPTQETVSTQETVAQCLVPAGTWQAARLLDAQECLVSCVVSPGFDFADWRLAAQVE